MAHAVEVGRLVEGGKLLRLDVPRLVATRLLVQGRSGGGKSWTLRRILEQTHGSIQHLVLDPEGEFASLRERFDYVLAGKGGDIAADPSTAALLAHRLLELRVSAVLDLYELKAQDRRRFVRLFLEALVNSPKKLWHPALVVLDEAHMFCPEKGEAESAEAVIELCQRGRKRGFACLLATQRLANLSKQAAAQCANVMVGPTFLDVDRKRALEMLGIAGDRKLLGELMALRPGQFWCVGAALIPGALSLVQIGAVQTHHPEIAGGRAVQPGPPPAPEKVRAVLSKLADLPQEAAEEANERETLRSRVVELQREVKRLEREVASKPAAGLPDAELRRREAEWQRAFEELKRERQQLTQAISEIGEAFDEMGDLDRLAKAGGRILGLVNRWDKPDYQGPDVPAPRPEAAAATERRSPPEPATRRGISTGRVDTSVDTDYRPRAGARRMLEALARYHLGSMTEAQLRTMARLKKSGTSGTYLTELSRNGLIERNGKEDVRITDAGLAMVGASARTPMTPAETLDAWQKNLRLGERRMLDALVEDGGRGMTREQLGEATHLTPSSGTFGTYLGTLRRNGLAVESDGAVRLAEFLLEGRRV